MEKHECPNPEECAFCLKRDIIELKARLRGLENLAVIESKRLAKLRNAVEEFLSSEISKKKLTKVFNETDPSYTPGEK